MKNDQTMAELAAFTTQAQKVATDCMAASVSKRTKALRKLSLLANDTTAGPQQLLLDSLNNAIAQSSKTGKTPSLTGLLATAIENGLEAACSLLATEIHHRPRGPALAEPLKLVTSDALRCFWKVVCHHNVFVTPIMVANNLSLEQLPLSLMADAPDLEQLSVAAGNIHGIAALFDNSSSEKLIQVQAAAGCLKTGLNQMIAETLKKRAVPSQPADIDMAAILSELDSTDWSVRQQALKQLFYDREVKDADIVAIGRQLRNRWNINSIFADCVVIGSSRMLRLLATGYFDAGFHQEVLISLDARQYGPLAINSDAQLSTLGCALYEFGLRFMPVFFDGGYSPRQLVHNCMASTATAQTLKLLAYAYPQMFAQCAKNDLLLMLQALKNFHFPEPMSVIQAAIDKHWPEEGVAASTTGAEAGVTERLCLVALSSGGYTVVDTRDGRTCLVAPLGQTGRAAEIERLEFELAAQRAVQAAGK